MIAALAVLFSGIMIGACTAEIFFMKRGGDPFISGRSVLMMFGLFLGITLMAVLSYTSGKNACVRSLTTTASAVSCPEDSCDRYQSMLDDWIKAYEEQEDIMLQCRSDLIRTQNELNHDIMCSDKVCDVR